ncbi:hypothetical protein LUZ61_012610 [Rhynchospora tenuis]|uniref:Aspergillus nuclease S1 n=1 Tax=Rhynchospora tenuis TaxID=198213 RepID=A0AAD6A3E8_9POAL|nr:hypothetical protein LUZ61_012610 [Rhynchospora tenuis]
MFLAHFVGDIHQPLHCGFAADYGGNNIPVNWYDVKSNLHRDYYAQKVNKWKACGNDAFACAKKFASESIELVCALAYKDVQPDFTLGDDYFTSRISTVEERIMQAAIRLASLLNKIFSNIQEDSSPKISQVLRSMSESVDN